MDFKMIGAYAFAGVKFGAKVLTKVGCTAGGLVLGVKAGEIISRGADEDTATVVTFAAGATGAMLGSCVGDGVIAVAKAVVTPDEDDDDATVDVDIDITVEGDDDDDESEGFDPYCSDCPYRDEAETTSDEKGGDTEDVGATFPDASQQGSDVVGDNAEVVDDTTPAEQPAEPNESATADEEVLPSVPAAGTDVIEPVAEPPVDEDPVDSATAVEVDPAEEFVEAAVLDPDGAVEDLLGKQSILQKHRDKQNRRNEDAHKGDRKYDKFN